MAKTVLENDIVVILNPGQTLSFPHGIIEITGPKLPDDVYPDRATPIVCTIKTDTTCTFNNPDLVNAQTAVFRAWRLHSSIRVPGLAYDPQRKWQGLGAGGGGGGSETLQQAYTAGAPGTAGVITLSAAGGGFAITDPRAGTVTSRVLTITAGPYTAMPNAEFIDVLFNDSANFQFVGGVANIPLQRGHVILARNYIAAAPGLTIDDLLGVTINMPTTGANVTAARVYGLGITGVAPGLTLWDTTGGNIVKYSFFSDPNVGLSQFNTYGGVQIDPAKASFQTEINSVAAPNGLYSINGCQAGGGAPSRVLWSVDGRGDVVHNQYASVTGSPIALLINGGAHTTLANAQASDVFWSFTRPVEIAGGAGNIPNWSVFRVGAPTISAVAPGQTITWLTNADFTMPVIGANLGFGSVTALTLRGAPGGSPPVMGFFDPALVAGAGMFVGGIVNNTIWGFAVNLDPLTGIQVDPARASGFMSFRNAGSLFSFVTQGPAGTAAQRLQIDNTQAAKTTPLLVDENGTLRRISIGAAAGVGGAGAADAGLFCLQVL